MGRCEHHRSFFGHVAVGADISRHVVQKEEIHRAFGSLNTISSPLRSNSETGSALFFLPVFSDCNFHHFTWHVPWSFLLWVEAWKQRFSAAQATNLQSPWIWKHQASWSQWEEAWVMFLVQGKSNIVWNKWVHRGPVCTHTDRHSANS